MKARQFELPNQTESNKNEKWHVMHANMMVEFLNSTDFTNRLNEIAKLEQQYLATPRKRETVTNPYNQGQIGGSYDVYPLTESILDDVTGKYLARPPERTPYSLNKDAISSKLDAKVDILMESLTRSLTEEINGKHNIGLETDNPDMDMKDKETPEEVEEFFTKSYKTNAEELSLDIIEQFLDVNKNIDKIKPMLLEYLYGSTTCCEIVEENGHPMLKTYRYDSCYFDIDPNKEVQDDIQTFANFEYKSESQIYNEFALTGRQKKKVRECFANMEAGSVFTEPLNTKASGAGVYSNCSKGVSYTGWMDITNNSERLRVMTLRWKSRRETRTLSYMDKTTSTKKYKILPSDYKERKRDEGNIIVDSIETIHYIKMLGPEIVLDWGEMEDRHDRIDNPAKAYLPVVGLVEKTYLKQQQVRSLARKLSPLQQFASDVLFQMKTYINKLDGKVLIYDAAQIPKHFIQTYGESDAINRVFHHMRKDGVAIINSADKKAGHVFNQFSSVDLSNRGLFKDLTDSLMLIEQLAAKFSGLTKENQEGGEKYQTATSVNRSIISSNSRIEVYFEPFDNLIGTMLTKMLQFSKVVYEKGEVFQQTYGDVANKFMSIHKDFFDADIGLQIANSAKNYRDKSIIDEAASMSLSNAQDPRLILGLIDVLETDSASESKAIFSRVIGQMEKQQEAVQAQAQEMEKARLDKEKEDAQVQIDENQKDRDNTYAIALLQADQKAEAEATRNNTQKGMKAADLESQQNMKDQDMEEARRQEAEQSQPTESSTPAE